MPVLTTGLDARSDEFRRNMEAMRALVDDLRAQTALIEKGGNESARQKHLARGKLLPRDRVHGLLDAASPFLELSPLAAHGMYGEQIPAAGIITGVGRVA